MPNARSGAVVLAEEPLELRRREVRIRDEAGALADQLGGQLRAALGGAAVLPDDRVVHRHAGRAVPEERRLALVRDPDRASAPRRAPARRPRARSARSPPVRARPSPSAGSAAAAPRSRGREPSAPRRRAGTSCPSFPGRSRGSSGDRIARRIFNTIVIRPFLGSVHETNRTRTRTRDGGRTARRRQAPWLRPRRAWESRTTRGSAGAPARSTSGSTRWTVSACAPSASRSSGARSRSARPPTAGTRPTRPTTGRTFDPVLDGLHAHGITPLVTIWGSPEWANGGHAGELAAEKRLRELRVRRVQALPVGPSLDRMERAEHRGLLAAGLADALREAAAQSGVRPAAPGKSQERRRRRRDLTARDRERDVADGLHAGHAGGARSARRVCREPVPVVEARDAVLESVLVVPDVDDGAAAADPLARDRALRTQQAALADGVRLPDESARPAHRRLPGTPGAADRPGCAAGVAAARRHRPHPLPRPGRAEHRRLAERALHGARHCEAREAGVRASARPDVAPRNAHGAVGTGAARQRPPAVRDPALDAATAG